MAGPRRPAAAAAAVKQPSQLQLGVDIPISLQRVNVGGGPDSNGKAFLLVVPDIDAGGC